mmetsp:Transcript_26437/g.87685  ORF Transcript_26437/g.87685 Transcript_26437/m.87685 type:complete len:259 (+) Transcript_26437:1022-1798(+)
MSRDKSKKASNENLLSPQLLSVHCTEETSNPRNNLLGVPVSSAFGSGIAEVRSFRNASETLFTSSSSMSRNMLRSNSCASSWEPKLNSPNLGNHRMISLGPVALLQQKSRFAGLTLTCRLVATTRTPMRASSASKSAGIGPSMTASWPLSSGDPAKRWTSTRSPMRRSTGSDSSEAGRGSRQLAIIASRSQRKQPLAAPHADGLFVGAATPHAPLEALGDEAPPSTLPLAAQVLTRCSLQAETSTGAAWKRLWSTELM